VAALLDKHLVVRLLSLVRMCGPFNCGAGIKFLQLMGTVLQSRSSNPDVDMLVTCHILLSYASSIVDDAVSALQGDQEQQRLGFSGLRQNSLLLDEPEAQCFLGLLGSNQEDRAVGCIAGERVWNFEGKETGLERDGPSEEKSTSFALSKLMLNI
ncbi:unnamed protein product, partial [Durusdinium trenchii]